MDAFSVLRLLISFVIGAIPFAVVAMWGTGVDITAVGSKNPGFNNVLRVSTKWRAAIALIGDVSKGLVAVAALSRSADPLWMPWALGLAAVVGHCWSPFLGFNGGKGVATTTGMLLYVESWITLACLPLYPALRWLGRRMGMKQEGAVSSLITMAVITIAVFVLRGAESGAWAATVLVLVIARHHSNLREALGSGGEGEKTTKVSSQHR